MYMETLYERIGEQELKAILTRFYDLVYEDERINHLFANPKGEVIDKQVCFMTQFLGGPMLYNEKYGHPRMRMRHMPHKITPDGMGAWLENIKKAILESSLSEDLKVAFFNSLPKLAAHMVNSSDEN